MLAVLSGGTGTPKLLQGLKEVLPEEEIAVIVNTAEDEWLPHGYLSPDIDTVLYMMCDLINEKTWYGIKGDTFKTHNALLKMGYDEILNIGDTDRATQIQKGELLRKGLKLCEAVDIQRKAWGIKSKIFPMSDDEIRTVIVSNREMSLHEFLIKYHGRPKVKKIYFRGIESAKACKEAVNAIKKAEAVIIGPSNPVSSILPIISLQDIRKEIEKKMHVIAISPIINKKPVSGPASKFMCAVGLKTDAHSIAKLYSGFINLNYFVVHKTEKIEPDTKIKYYKTNIIMKNLEDKKTLARVIIDLLNANFLY